MRRGVAIAAIVGAIAIGVGAAHLVRTRDTRTEPQSTFVVPTLPPVPPPAPAPPQPAPQTKEPEIDLEIANPEPAKPLEPRRRSKPRPKTKEQVGASRI